VITVDRPVRFEEVDAAGIVFFARFFHYCHEVMETFFDEGLPRGPSGLRGYADLITRRRIGFPAVHVDVDYTAPLRYGDVARIALTVAKVGTSSTTLRYAFTRMPDGAAAAVVQHVVVSSSLDAMKKMPLPDDVRALLVAHTA